MATTRIKSNQQLTIAADLDFANFKGINVATPVGAGDIANKAYVDAVKQALDIKDSVDVATNGAETYTIVGGAVTVINGTQIDGVSLTVGSRILVKNAPAASGAGAGANTANTTQPANGIYVVTNATTNLTVERSSDADTSSEVTAGLFVFSARGTNSADNGYVLTTDDSIVLNTTGLTFTQFSGAGQIVAGDGLVKTGNTINAVGTAGRIVVGADNIDLATVTPLGTASSAIRKIDFDAYGRISGAVNANLTDIITSIGTAIGSNAVFIGPDGSTGAPSFRALTAAGVPNLDTAKITTGILPIARGGTALGTTPTNGQLLIGNGAGYTLAVLASGTGISTTVGAGSIQINNTGVTSAIGTANQVAVSGATGAVTFSLPQNIHTGATPTFARLTLTDGTQTTSTPVLSMTQSWNAGAVTFEGFKINITDTASAAASLLIDLEVGGTSRFAVRKDGAVVSGSWAATTIAATVGGTGHTLYAIGDILVANTTTSLSRLAGVATGNALISGGVGSAPSYGKIGLTTHISGTLPIANGGTNLTAAPTNGQLLVGNGTGYTLATLTGSATISVTNAAGSITLNAVTGASGVITAPNFVVGEIPTGTINGVNAVFTLANTPLAGKEIVHVNGIRQQVGAGNDYTISGATITFLSGAIPQTGDNILVDYLRS
jgi:hypothetical protein